MGLPSITIAFKEKGITAIKRSQRGIDVLILKEEDPTKFTSPYTIYTSTDIPSMLSDFNKEQIGLALIGYQTSPKKILVYIESKTAENYNDILVILENQRWDYLAIPEIADTETQTIATWIKSMRTVKDKQVKAVLPNMKADNEGVINVTNSKIVTKAKSFTTAEY